jgi:hypothetical protein
MENPRKHFEAVLADLANIYEEDRVALRDEVKDILIKHGRIKRSTTELDDETLENIADRLHTFYFNQTINRPPDWGLAELNIESIII